MSAGTLDGSHTTGASSNADTQLPTAMTTTMARTAMEAPPSGIASASLSGYRAVVTARAPMRLTRSRNHQQQLLLCRGVSVFRWSSMRSSMPIRSSSGSASVASSSEMLEECSDESCNNVAALALASLSSEKQTRVPKTAEEVAKGDSQYIVGTYVRPPVLFTRGKGEQWIKWSSSLLTSVTGTESHRRIEGCVWESCIGDSIQVMEEKCGSASACIAVVVVMA